MLVYVCTQSQSMVEAGVGDRLLLTCAGLASAC